MFSRPMLFLSVLAAAIVVPYVLLDEHLAGTVRDGWDSLLGRFEKEKDDELNALHAANYSPASGTPGSSVPTPIEHVFRFDLTPQWVASRWPRVSTVAGSDPDQLGMRVVLVTGTRPDDIAGSLTYYFDRHHQLQRITFTGQTRDPRRLMATVITPYKLKSQPTTDAAHYIAGNSNEPTSEVIVRNMPVIVAERGFAETEVEVDLSRGDALGLRGNAIGSRGNATSSRGNTIGSRENATSSRGREDVDSDGKLIPSAFRRW